MINCPYSNQACWLDANDWSELARCIESGKFFWPRTKQLVKITLNNLRAERDERYKLEEKVKDLEQILESIKALATIEES